jgi:hypothetical protein
MGNLNKTILEFTEFIKSYADTKTADTIVKNLTDFAADFVLIIDSIKKNKNYDDVQSTALLDLTNFLQQGTMDFWYTLSGGIPARTYADTYIAELIKQVISRLQKNWSDDGMAVEKARNIISAGGPIYGTPFNNNQDIGTIFANSIINHFPTKFI